MTSLATVSTKNFELTRCFFSNDSTESLSIYLKLNVISHALWPKVERTNQHHVSLHHASVYTHLSYKLDNLDKNIKGHIPGHNATTPFGEESGGDGRQTTEGKRRDKKVETCMFHFLTRTTYFHINSEKKA